MSQKIQMVWEWVVDAQSPAGRASPRPPRTAAGEVREPDGQVILSLEQAVERSGKTPAALQQDWRDTFDGMLGEDQGLLVAAPAELLNGAAAATEGVTFKPDPRSAESIRGAVMARYSPRMDLIRAWKYSFLDDDNWALFLTLCEDKRLNPGSNQVFAQMVPDRDTSKLKLVLIVGIEGMRLLARRTGERAGTDKPKFTYDGATLLSAEVTVYRRTNGHRDPYTAEASRAEYLGVGLREYHEEMPQHHLAKCAEALALRMAFPDELGGLYVKEEFDRPTPGGSSGASGSPRFEPSVDRRPGVYDAVDEIPPDEGTTIQNHQRPGGDSLRSAKGMSWWEFVAELEEWNYPAGHARDVLISNMRMKYRAICDKNPPLFYRSVINDLENGVVPLARRRQLASA